MASDIVTGDKRCGGLDHAHRTRPCLANDTLCGHWTDGRYFHPYACEYQDISSRQARKCLGNRTLAFIGDTHIRSIGIAVAYLLLDVYDLSQAPDEKFNHFENIGKNSTKIPNFSIWKNNVPAGNGYVYPNIKKATKHNWQIQIWSLYNYKYLMNQVDYILNNSLPQHFDYLRDIDLAFWSHGLHDYGWFNKPPYGQKFYDQIASKWMMARKTALVPTVWVSLNPECPSKLEEVRKGREDEDYIVDECNFYINRKLLKYRLPYWDAAAPLRTRERCNASDDGVHVKVYVDIMRAKMLFNHLCDKDMNWVGGPDRFV
jgi:hypothetical protein